MQKFWTVQNGQVGTAHLGRDSQLVDFRPAGKIAIRRKDGWIEISPPKGQEGLIEPLVLLPTNTETLVVRKDDPQVGRNWVEDFCAAEFQGLTIEATGNGRYEWCDLVAKKDAEEAFERQHDLWKAKEEEQRKFLRELDSNVIIDSATSREIGRLRAKTLDVSAIAGRILREAFDIHFPREPEPWVYVRREIRRRSESGELEEIRKEILNRDDQRREERKRQYMAR